MLLILIPMIWFALACVFVGMCRAAAHGDASLQIAMERPSQIPIEGPNTSHEPHSEGATQGRHLRGSAIRGHSARYAARSLGSLHSD
jgi:hypothetical protein